MNPCPCGYYGDNSHQCTCNPNEIKRYTKKISGPLLDRIDIHITVPRLEYSELMQTTPTETSIIIRSRVEIARQIQRERLRSFGLFCNAQMSHRHLKKTCILTQNAQNLLEKVFAKMNLSARSYDRIIKVSRTIADLGNADTITERHVAEAIQLRSNVQPS